MRDMSDRGQVGIGTLIVFIAMVLVAAIAAGVLINTADVLQTQAEQTGDEATDQVSNSLRINSVTGYDDGDNGNIDRIELVVSTGPGSDDIALENVELQVLSDTQDLVVLNQNNPDSAGGEEFTTSSVTDSSPDVLSSGEQVVITIDTNAGESTEALNAFNSGDDVEITATTPSGSQAFESFTIPDILDTPEEL